MIAALPTDQRPDKIRKSQFPATSAAAVTQAARRGQCPLILTLGLGRREIQSQAATGV